MKRFSFTVLFLLTASFMLAQPLIPSSHGLEENQPAWNHDFPQAQEYTLASGFAWWSSYIDLSGDGLAKLKNALSGHASLIKNTTQFISYAYNSETNAWTWTGTLTNLQNNKMYYLQITDPITFEIEGNVVNTEEVIIEYAKEWNWLGYPSTQATVISEALSDYQALNGEVFKNKNGFSTYNSTSNTWVGSVQTLIPGQGYMLQSKHEEAGTFHYNTGSKETVIEDHPAPIWNANHAGFATNMCVLACIQLKGEELRSEDYELGAFAGDECRGATPILYIKETDSYLAFLTISGENGDAFQFRLLDRTTGTVYTEANNFRITYNDNDVVGTLNAPCLLTFKNMLSSEETLAGMMRIFPNPVEHSGSLHLSLPEHMANNADLNIQIVDLLGQVVKEEHMSGNECAISSDFTPGLYMVKVFANGALILNNKLMVK